MLYIGTKFLVPTWGYLPNYQVVLYYYFLILYLDSRVVMVSTFVERPFRNTATEMMMVEA